MNRNHKNASTPSWEAHNQRLRYWYAGVAWDAAFCKTTSRYHNAQWDHQKGPRVSSRMGHGVLVCKKRFVWCLRGSHSHSLSIAYYLLGQFTLQLLHDIAALLVVAHLRLDEGVQVAQMRCLRCADPVQQQLGNLRLPVELGLSHPQVPFRLEKIAIRNWLID